MRQPPALRDGTIIRFGLSYLQVRVAHHLTH
uniref:Uncharacterized protein n=1 Tax=Ralstonia solanacearum TaxID=305 RepID=A0A0S4V0X8_RALSL|nr:protein of unknown function [Ralstonia solanacearum]